VDGELEFLNGKNKDEHDIAFPPPTQNMNSQRGEQDEGTRLTCAAGSATGRANFACAVENFKGSSSCRPNPAFVGIYRDRLESLYWAVDSGSRTPKSKAAVAASISPASSST
ncbi:unnamed protein product, partial [Amoebophrya sp. A120]